MQAGFKEQGQRSMSGFQHSSRTQSGVLTAALLLIALPLARAQGTASPIPPAPAQTHPSDAIEIDRVVAVVNGQLILESDVDEERRMGAFQPLSSPQGSYSRQEAISRLIDRALILQQARQQPLPPITDQELDANVPELQKSIFACRQYHCETAEGWQGFLAANGFTDQEFRQRWRERMEMLRFIEARFRMGIRIEPAEINDYYQKTLLPEYAVRHAPPPPLSAISNRIQEILLQQRVSKLLDDWLTALRASGNVVLAKTGVAIP